MSVNDIPEYKLPYYIEDKNMYAAVVRACEWIKRTGHFNIATEWCANRYGVDIDELRYIVSHAATVGRKQAFAERGPINLMWYALKYRKGKSTAYVIFRAANLGRARELGIAKMRACTMGKSTEKDILQLVECQTLEEATNLASKWEQKDENGRMD